MCKICRLIINTLCATCLLAGTLFAESPQRIVSLTPCATDILSALGVSQELVGITRYCVPLPGTQAQRIGGLIDPSSEMILALKPDLLIQADIRDKSFLERMAKQGIPYVTLFPESYENIKRDIALLGEKTGRTVRAKELLEKWEKAEKKVEEALAKQPLVRRPRVLIRWGEVFAGRASYLHDLIERCGGANAAPEKTPRAWPVLTKETILETGAEILICVTPDGPKKIERAPNLAAQLKKEAAFALLPAVRRGNVFQLNENSRLLYPSPLLMEAIPQLAEAIRQSDFSR